MKRNYVFLLTCAMATGAMAQWQHMGLDGLSPTSGGVQVVDGAVYFHSAENQAVMYRSGDAGASWQIVHFADEGLPWRYLTGKHGQYINYGASMTGPKGLYRKLADENSWNDLHRTITDFDVMASGRVVASTGIAGEGSIVLSDQFGDGWASSFPSTGNVRTRLIGRDGQDRLLVQAFTASSANDQDLGLFRSADQGDSWERINEIKFDLTGASANADHSIFCSNGLRIMKSTNDGEKWMVSSVDFPYAGVTGSTVFNMGGGHIFFMCHESGMTNGLNLYQTFDFGINWSPVEEEISQHLIFNMARDASGHVFASTDNGVYRMDMAVAVSIGDPTHTAKVFAYPVPTADNLVVNAGGAMMSELRMYDASSREVLFVPNVDKPAATIQVGHLSPGIYILRAVTNKGIATTNVVVE